MATERQLRNRMRQLEEALAQQERENRRIQQQIAAQTQEQIRRMQQESMEVFQQRLNETSAAYAQRVREFQETVMRQNRQQLEQLQHEAEAVRRQTQETLKEMEACTTELRRELQKLRDDASRQATVFRQAAQEAQAQALTAQQQVEQTPHDFFFPQEFDIISSHLQDITGLIDSGMYQAAVSDAGCIELELSLLRNKVEQAFSEWMQAFEDYRAIVIGLYQRLQEFEGRQHQTSAGSFRMKTRELDFWSCGAYSEMAEQITGAYNTFCLMDQAQILEYLRNSAGTNRRAIYTLITEGKRWEDQLLAIMNCVVSERLFSDQRLTVAQDVADQLEELNYRVEVNQFCPPDAYKQTQKWYIAGSDEDPQNSFDLHMMIGRENRVKLHIIPRREHGLAVENLYFLSVDLFSTADPITEGLVAQDTLNHISQVFQSKNILAHTQYISSQDDPEAVIRKQEQIMSTPPSTSAQMRYLERKYR